MRPFARVLLLGFLFLAGAACTRGAAAPGVNWTPCRIEGFSEEIRCATLSVPEDRRDSSSRHISLRVAVVPALARVPRPDPLVLLAGGPGQAATSLGPWIGTVFRAIRRQRDIVLVDQRGTGGSVALRCASDADFEPLGIAFQAEASRRCLASLHNDPRFYTNAAAIQDLEEVRGALGYPQLNIWGGSFGTRTALTYMGAYPDRVRSAVLDGVAPWSLRFPLYTARDGQRALDRLLDDCTASPDCARAFPSLRARLMEVLLRLQNRAASIAIDDPASGRSRTLIVTRDDFAVALRGFLYMGTHASAVPLVIDRAHAGDFRPFAALRQAVASWSIETMSLGMTRSVLCSEDVPRIPDDEVRLLTAGTIAGPAEIAIWRAICEPWPRGPLPDGSAAHVRFDGPVLLLSGELDPVVPPAWGEAVRATMPRARHIVAPGTGHNVTPVGCTPDLIAQFVEQADASRLDARCLDGLRRPPFVTSLAGWRP